MASNIKNPTSIFWFVIFALFLIPLSNSFLANISKIVNSIIINNQYKSTLNELYKKNDKLTNKVRYYESLHGLKTLIKDRLNKVEDGEILIKFNKQSMDLD